jgi:pimeloyl-ACP methyl ester carboxylesterase
MRSKILAAAACGTVLAALVCAQGALAQAKSSDRVPRFEPAACPAMPIKALADARCGYLVVPEDRSRPAGRTIRLIVAIIPALSSQPKPDPVVYLAGGPGGIAIGEADLVVTAGLNRDRDLVIMNQRGTYLTEPGLTCASIDNFNRQLLGLRFYSEATKRTHLVMTEACHRHLAATGAELSAYNSTESAADFADLRKVLGYAQWNILGVSYGTDLAQIVMRDHPEGTRSVILDSVVPVTIKIPNYWRNTRTGFDNLFRACAAEAACNAAHPQLEQTFTALVNKLEAEPLTTTVKDPATGNDTKVVLDGGALVDWLRNQSYSTALFPGVPDLIGGLTASRPEAIESIAKDRAGRAPPSAPDAPSAGYGLGFGVVCREQYPFATRQDLIAAGREAFPRYAASIREEAVGTWAYISDDCRDVWKVPAAPAEVRRLPASTIPTLLISGSFDAITSLDGAKAVAVGLANATTVSIPGVGHFVAPESACAQAVIASFLADPGTGPDTSCVGTLTPPSFTPQAAP